MKKRKGSINPLTVLLIVVVLVVLFFVVVLPALLTFGSLPAAVRPFLFQLNAYWRSLIDGLLALIGR